MSTIQDVARHAGVSISTISNFLNGRAERMGRDTLLRVQAAIADLQFKPNRAARQLKTGYTPMLGLLVPSIANPMYGYIAREIETSAQEEFGMRVLLGNTYRNQAKETGFFDDLLSHGVRGVVVISSLGNELHFESAVKRGLVMVSYDRRATQGAASAIDHVSVDNFKAGAMAARYLTDRGHRRIAFATVAGQTMSRVEKIKGFLDAAAQGGLNPANSAGAPAVATTVQATVIEEPTDSEYGDSEMPEAGRRLAHRLASQAQRPSGVVAVNDLMAFGLMAGFRECGLSVPSDVSVIGMDGLFLSSFSNPGLTTVRLPVAEMARTIVRRVIGRMQDPDIMPSEFLFEPDMVERESVAIPAPTV